MPNYHAEIICRAHLTAEDLTSAKVVADEIAKEIAGEDVHLVYETAAGHVWEDRPRQTREGSHPGAFTYLEMEAALCVWECLNDWTLPDSHETARQDWIEVREGIGSAELRHQSIALGQWLLKVYDICVAGDPHIFESMSYDWEVVPMILDHARDTGGALVVYSESLPHPAMVAAKVVAQAKRDTWMHDARAEAKKQWCYSGLVDDMPEVFQQACEAGEPVADVVRAVGEKYGLTPAGTW